MWTELGCLKGGDPILHLQQKIGADPFRQLHKLKIIFFRPAEIPSSFQEESQMEVWFGIIGPQRKRLLKMRLGLRQIAIDQVENADVIETLRTLRIARERLPLLL